MKPLRILFLSSKAPEHSANLGEDYRKALLSAGHYVDFNYPGMIEDIARIREKKKARLNNSTNSFLRRCKIFAILHRLGLYSNLERSLVMDRYPWAFVIGNESKPLIDPEIIASKTKGPYDLIITLFWENVITSHTLKVLSEKYSCPVMIVPIDMGTYTGGCYYFGSCSRYVDECRSCPAVNGLFRNIAHENFLKKKKNFSSMEVMYAGNSYMGVFCKKTHLFKDMMSLSLVINSNTFHPMDKMQCRKELGIYPDKRFIILGQYSNDPRKGYKYMVEAVKQFTSRLTTKEKKDILMLLIGQKMNTDIMDFDIDYQHLGFVKLQNLAKVYNASSVYLCTSLDDAGPSMVNQSIMCGTPVVAYNSGTAIDVIEDGVSGYKTAIKDSVAFGNYIEKIFRLSNEGYDNLSKTTRKKALECDSPEAFIKAVEETYYRFR